MGRKEQKLNSDCGNRLKEWLKESKTTQKELAQKVNYTQQYISDVVCNKKPMSVELAQRVADKTSAGYSFYYEQDVRIRASYLLGLDDIKTNVEFQEKYNKQAQNINNSVLALLDNAWNEVFLTEELAKLKARGISENEALKQLQHLKPPVIESVADVAFLSQQLKDEANKLMWAYMHRDTSPVWTFLDK